MRAFVLGLLALAASSSAAVAQPAGLVPPTPAAAPAEPDAMPLYGEATPGTTAGEIWSAGGTLVRDVTRPTLTPVLPAPGKANGTAVIVAPGGAFMILAMDHEGWAVAHALADRGITAFVLKYRLIPTPLDAGEFQGFMNRKMTEGLTDPTKMPSLQFPESTDDGLAAIALVRANAAKWGIDPHRVGMIGFSAGAMTTLNTALAAPAGKGPDFIGYIYGPQAGVPVPASVPPMFDAIAFDDMFFQTMGFPLAEAWHKAGRPVEVHAYQAGNHGFGLGKPGMTTGLVLDEFTAWMAMNGMIPPARK